MVKCEGDPIVPRAKLNADFFLLIKPSRGEKIPAFPEDQSLAEIKPFENRRKLRNPRIFEPAGYCRANLPGKCNQAENLRLGASMKFETVFTLLK